MIGCGLLFELPVLVFFLAKIGLATPAFMRHYRRHAIVLIMVISAFVTPPDPVSLFMMTLPLVVLYEISIVVAWLVTKGK
jgi:sec-independent protein translocase protein TatC